MEPVVEQFRTALGGFHRGDVQQYLEKMSTIHRQQVERLEEELQASQKKQLEMEAELTALRQVHANLVAEEGRVRASLEESTKTLTRLRGEQTQTDTKLAMARSELQRLHAQVDQLQPLARKYEQLKDDVAKVEYEARLKGQALVDQARQEALNLQNDTTRWLYQVLQGYGELRREMDEMVEHMQRAQSIHESFTRGDEMAAKLKEQGGFQ